jgi:hypothetical protein
MRVVERKRGYAMIFDGAVDMMTEAAKAVGAAKNYKYDPSSWEPCNVERPFTTWENALEQLSTASPKNIEQLESVQSEIQAAMSVPKSRLRRARWNEDDGELNVDRWFAGDAAYRQPYRVHTRGPAVVSVVCNLDGSVNDGAGPIFWRGASAIAVADLLETAGYGVDLVLWCKGHSVYVFPKGEQLSICRLKEAGDPMNRDSLLTGLSAWFLRTAVFGSFTTAETAGAVQRGIGGMNYSLSKDDETFLDIPDGVARIDIPVEFNRRGMIQKVAQTLGNFLAENE